MGFRLVQTTESGDLESHWTA